MTDYLFTYGTLRPSTKATHVIVGYDMYDYGKYPYIVETDYDHEVVGNLVKVPEDKWPELDRYEGIHKGLYTREETVAYDENNEQVICYVYVATDALHPKRIESGDWYNRGT